MENSETPAQTEVVHTKPFEMPKTLEEVDSRVNEYADILKSIDVDWNLRMQAFKHFQKLLQEGQKMEGFLPLVASKKNIVASLAAQTEDRRSQIVKDACITIAIFANTIKKEFAHYADELFVVLSKLLIVTIKVISDSAHSCILSFLPYATNLLPSIYANLSAAHPAQRSKSAEYLQAVLEKNDKSDIEAHLEVVEASLKKALTDANAAARASGKKSFLAYKSLFNERADKFAETLDPSVAKLLVEVKKPVKAATDLKSLMQKNKQNKPTNPEDVVAVLGNAEVKEETKSDSGSSSQQIETPKEPEKPAEKAPEPVAPGPKPENMNVDIAVPNDVETRTRSHEEAPAPKRPLEETTNSVPVRPKRQNTKKGNKDNAEEDQENVSKAKTSSRAKSSKRGGKQPEYTPGNTPIAMRVRSRPRNTLRA